jgi:deazaflavin-dependent oxidoreductase (nitroreductase family)
VRASGKLNVPVYRLTRGRIGNKVGNAPVLLLTTTGRRSGQQRTAPVVFIRDGENVIVIGSNAGNHEPAWSLNLKAHPEAEIEIGPKRSRVRARLAAGEERERLWAAMNEQYEGFDAYKAKAGREDIPVFALEPR